MKKKFAIACTAAAIAAAACMGYFYDPDSDKSVGIFPPTPASEATSAKRDGHEPARASLPISGSASEGNGTRLLEKNTSRIGIASSALKSEDPLFVREQQEIVRNCAALSRREQDLRVMASGVFNKSQEPASPSEKALVIDAINNTLAACKDFLSLGIVALKQLSENIGEHGKSLNSPLFSDSEDKVQLRAVAAQLLTSSSPPLIELGSYSLIRGIEDDGLDDPPPKSRELWDRAILVAGCRLGGYCDASSLQSQRLCWQSRKCDMGMQDYWLSELDDKEASEVKRKADLLVKWIKASSANGISTIKKYADFEKLALH
ncbi:hypothetical protein [Pelomonas sp. BJYL3]|uniref:hypothetical protein n=1 Tax=Pelomonas sp. BJYL3 TaxID=2976697 RepID=UPI0022B4E740|nr:hypothetical protein [Pelomonas sp. BJYL3]